MKTEKTFREMLEEVGGYENEFIPINAGAVRKIIDTLEEAQEDVTRWKLKYEAKERLLQDYLITS